MSGFIFQKLNKSVPQIREIFIKIYNFLLLASLDIFCCVWAFSSCSEQVLLFIVVHRLLIAVASLVVEHGV